MNTGILVFYFCFASPAAALTMHKSHNHFTPLENTIQTGDVPVLNMSEAPTFFEAWAKQDSNKDLIKQNSLGTRPPKVLILMYGLMRMYKETWPIVANQLNLAGLVAGGGKVDLIVATDLTTRCSDKETSEGRCRQEWYGPTNEQYAKEIKEAYQPYIRAVFDDPTNGAAGRIIPAVEKHFGFNAPDTAFVRKLVGGSSDPFSQYDHVLALRTDATFSHDFDISDVCARYPGMNFIHGDYECGCYIHWADSDKAFLACEAQLMRNFLRPQASCEGLTDPPPIPEGFGGSWQGHGFDWPGVGQASGPGMGECHQILEFQNIGKRLGSLDDDGIYAHIN